MHNKITKAITASFMAAAMLTTTVATVAPMTVSAGEILGESDFSYKALPWHTCETNPGKQTFELTDAGEAHITVVVPEGGEKSKWDLQFRHRNIDLKQGHQYKISCKIKSNRNGMEICSKIGDISGKLEYVELKDGKFVAGPSMGGEWGNAAKLTTEYQTFEGTFTCTKDLEGVEWAFHYAKDSNGFGGNAQEGDEIWFDDMHLEDLSSNEYDANQDDYVKLGAVRRDDSGLTNNFISVNQIGYYSNLSKVAVLGDNKGDITNDASSIDIAEGSTYDFKVINDETGAEAFTGKTSAAKKDPDSGDTVCKIDFTDLTDAGTYHIEVGEWQSFPFKIGDDIYTDTGDKSYDMLTNALNYYYQNRSGIDIEMNYITSGTDSSLAHQGGHKVDTATVQKEWVRSYSSKEEATGTYASSAITASGGWYDAGDHGKYVVNGGISVWTLQNMYERTVVQGSEDKFDNGSGTVVIPETNNGVPDILDEAAVELDWMMKMVVQSNEPTWGKYAGLVYHKLHDHKWTGLAVRPWNYDGPQSEGGWDTVRIVKPPTFAATLNFVACAAQAARLWEPYDSEKAAEYLEAAKTSYAAFKKIYADYPAYTDAENSNPTSLYAPLDQAIGGGAYGDSDVTDDAYWAACELYAATGDSEYYTDLSGYKDAFKVVSYLEGGENKGSFSSFNWGNTASCGSLTLYLNENNSKLSQLTDANKTSITNTIKDAADLYVNKENEQGYGIPYEGTSYTDPVNLPADLTISGFEWGSNSFVVNNAMIMAYAYDITDDIKYMNGVTTSMDYILGTNPLSVSYVTGYGSYHISRPHHRYWSHELDSSLPMAPDGIISGGPNAGLQDPYVRALGFVPGDPDNPSERCYVDSIEAWSTNEVTINWNAPFAWVVSFLQDEAANASSEGVLKVTPSTVEVEVGKTETLKPTVDGSEVDATFTSNDSSVVTVDENGTITGVAEGSTTITVTYGDKSVEVKVTVTDSTKTSETNATEDTNETTPSYTGNASLLYGDVNLDLAVDSTDVVVLNKYLISKTKYPLQNDQAIEQANTADYDARKIDSKDSMAIINCVLGLISKDDLGPQK